jgi:DeoR/GlpR family transcriptional regulator of sugar metabolism
MDKVFLSVTGLSSERGATTLETDEALVYRKMLKQAKQVIVVADSSKIAMISPALICPASDIDLLITDKGITAKALAAFKANGVQVMAV